MLCVEKLSLEILLTNSLVCVGLDPIVGSMPIENVSEANILQFFQAIVDITAQHCSGYKCQKAFFDEFDFGHHLLKEIVNYIKVNYPSKTVIIDCKIGDVEHTLKAYTRNLFENINGDGIVVNPYMGSEIFDCFRQYPDNLFVVLVKTSNPGSSCIQNLILDNGDVLWMHILKILTIAWYSSPNCMPVVSFDNLNDFKSAKNILPDKMPIFYAGFGAQGKKIDGLSFLLNQENGGVLVNSSRGLIYTDYNKYPSWKDAVLNNTINMKNLLNGYRH